MNAICFFASFGSSDDSSDSDSDSDCDSFVTATRDLREETLGILIIEIFAGGICCKVKRSAAVDGFPKWYNDKEKDEVSYKVWRRKLDNKLENNADYWLTDRAKMNAIESFIIGQAGEAIAFYMEYDYFEHIRTFDQLLTWLDNEYSNVYEKADAKLEFCKLMMAFNETFMDFKNKFVFLAGCVYSPKFDYKEEIYDKFADVPCFCLQLTRFYLDDDSFESYCCFATQIDADQRRINQICFEKKFDGKNIAALKNNNSLKNNFGKASFGFTVRITGKIISAYDFAKQRGFTEEETKELSNLGACFNCKQLGYCKRDCPEAFNIGLAGKKLYVLFDERCRAQMNAIATAYKNFDKLNDAFAEGGIGIGLSIGIDNFLLEN